jgi:hypothetical protein
MLAVCNGGTVASHKAMRRRIGMTVNVLLRPSIQLTDTGRVEAFSDGVFAVVATLLVSGTARLCPAAMVSGEVPA